jgi:glycosyltransferase involved in cell wall biosynthesis
MTSSSRPLKILMTADCVGGVWTYAMELARELSARNAEIALAVMGAELKPEQQREAASIPRLTVWPSKHKLEWMENPWDEVAQAGNWLQQIAAEFQPDVVHLNGYAHAALPWRAPVLVVAHSCVCSWWKAVKGGEAPGDWDCYRQVVRNGIQAADFVIAPSEAMLGETRRLFGPLPRCGVIYNGRNSEGFCAAEKEAFILSAGRLWDEGKNIRTLLEASSRLKWPLRVAGETENPGGPGAGLERGDAAFLGFLNSGEMREWYSRAAIFAMPAKYEPFGLAPLEAALSGCALVLGDIRSLREIWEEAAVFVHPSDQNGWIAALNQLASDAGLRRAKAEAARTQAVRYSSKKMGAGYFQLYQELAKASSIQTREEEVLCGS